MQAAEAFLTPRPPPKHDDWDGALTPDSDEKEVVWLTKEEYYNRNSAAATQRMYELMAEGMESQDELEIPFDGKIPPCDEEALAYLMDTGFVPEIIEGKPAEVEVRELVDTGM